MKRRAVMLTRAYNSVSQANGECEKRQDQEGDDKRQEIFVGWRCCRTRSRRRHAREAEPLNEADGLHGCVCDSNGNVQEMSRTECG